MKLVLASKNPHKLTEMQAILAQLGVEVVLERDVGADGEVEETGTTFQENAFLKARAVMEATGLPAVADDSGLMVDALDGGPGVYSARFAGPGASDADRNRKLLRELEGVPEEGRGAKFVSAICCVFPNGDRVEARGECPGRIGFTPVGENGFGYDPLFVVDGGMSYAELFDEEKDAISHRGNALRLFSARLEEYLLKNKA